MQQDLLRPFSLEKLLSWISREWQRNRSIFGIPEPCFFVPSESDPFQCTLFNRHLGAPVGVAAGPHTQMTQNIVAAWLCGARFIELKTVQTLDDLSIPRPCIDMQDEGYNVEWSQELSLEESLQQYVDAWVLIHVLHRVLGFPGKTPGVVFAASVGYDLAGIQTPNMQAFLKKIINAGQAVETALTCCERFFPETSGIQVPAAITNHVMLSTMHGCPPSEIGRIAEYLLGEYNVHTYVKLNPTLLGPERLRNILHDRLGYDRIAVPDAAFEHDLKFEQAVTLLHALREKARPANLEVGVKICNTLETINHGRVFNKSASETMYMSGRALHPVAVQVAAILSQEFGGTLPVSFSAGADCFNIADLFAAGMQTVTSCSDLLRPGGVMRIRQELETLRQSMQAAGAQSLDQFIMATCRQKEDHVHSAALKNLQQYADRVVEDSRYSQDAYQRFGTKTTRVLDAFDCIEAPCSEVCSVNQKVPLYMHAVANNEHAQAAEIVRSDNPLPSILGRACTHICENVCVRTHLDEPLAIREIKRFIMDHEQAAPVVAASGWKAHVGVVGAGPCGLAVAYFLCSAGYRVSILERRSYSGGMVSGSIPGYRAVQAAVDQDVEWIKSLGVEVLHNTEAGSATSVQQWVQQHDFTVLAPGAQQGIQLGLSNEDAAGVYDGLVFLRSAREGAIKHLPGPVGVVGGGDVAMDCARTAVRLGNGPVTIFYRRTMKEMPAQKEEIKEALEEGIVIEELLAPKEIQTDINGLSQMQFACMELGEPDESGRRRPVEIPGKTKTHDIRSLIVAIGQRPDFAFLNGLAIRTNRKGYIDVHPGTLETSHKNIFAGGDAIGNGPDTIVKACGDGKSIAAEIRRRVEGVSVLDDRLQGGAQNLTNEEFGILLRHRAVRRDRIEIPGLPENKRHYSFKEVVQTLSKDKAEAEASRCLQCHRLCSICAGVCPNRAIFTYRTEPLKITLPNLQASESAGVEEWTVSQRYQVAVRADLCNACGNCRTFCPTSGAPSKDKPRIYMARADLEQIEDNAYAFFDGDGGAGICGRFAGQNHQLVVKENILTYQSPVISCSAELHPFAVHDYDVSDSSSLKKVGGWKPFFTLYVLLSSLRDKE